MPPLPDKRAIKMSFFEPSAGAAGAMLCAASDVPVEFEAEVLEWHTREHLPERMGIPGFLCGRRFECLGEGPKLLFVYDIAATSVLSSPAYLVRKNCPTPWTTKSLSRLEGGFRSTFNIQSQWGTVEGSFAAILRFDLGEPAKFLASGVLEQAAAAGGMSRLRLVAPELSIVDVSTEAELRGVQQSNSWMIMIEAYVQEPLVEVAEDIRRRCQAEHLVAGPMATGFYRLQARATGTTMGAR